MKSIKERVITTITSVDQDGTVIEPTRIAEDKIRTVYVYKDGALRIKYLWGKCAAKRNSDGVLQVDHTFTRIKATKV